VKVMLKDGTYHEDVGYGMAEHPKKGSAIENAKKVRSGARTQLVAYADRLVVASDRHLSLLTCTRVFFYASRKPCRMPVSERCDCLVTLWVTVCTTRSIWSSSKAPRRYSLSFDRPSQHIPANCCGCQLP
jgi:hypothetical protein